MLPHVSATAMSEFLHRFAATRAPDEHAVMVLDGAGWHDSRAIHLPSNLSLVTLPPYSPELNPIERVWLYLRETDLSLRLLDDDDAVVEACCRAWCKLTPDRLRSLTAYPYLTGVIS